jgi:hypothetical protein
VRPSIASSVAAGDQTVWSTTKTLTTDRCITIAKLIERWPLGRTKIDELTRTPGRP